ncbi:hypothetical protein N8563_01205 [bacterium]|nr:hypothetical protein [bacterium]
MKRLSVLLLLFVVVVGCDNMVDRRKNACADAAISFDKKELEKLFGKSPLSREEINKVCEFYE